MAEEVVIDINVDKGGNAAKSLKQLKAEFKEQQKALEGLAVGSKEYIDQLKKLGATRDDIGDLNDTINAFAGKDKKIEAFGKAINGVAGGFSVATGAMGLFGTQSEETEKALLKVQSALALSQGIQSITSLGDSFKVLGTIIKANPIMIIATVIAGIITSFVGLDNIISGVKAGFAALGDAVSSAFDFIVEGVKYAIDLYTQYLDILTFGLLDINEQIEANKELIKQAEKQIEANKKIIAQIEERRNLVTKAYDQEIALANAAGKNTEELEAKKLQAVKSSLEKEIKLRIANFKLIQQIADKQIENAELASQKNNIFEERSAKIRAESAKERKRIQEQQLKDLENLLETTNNTIAVKEVEAETKRREAGQKAYEQRSQDEEEFLKNKKSLEELYAEEDRKFREKQQKEYLESLKANNEEEIAINLDALEQNVKVQEQKSLDDNARDVAERQRQKGLNAYRIGAVTDTLSIISNLTELFAGKSKKQQETAFKIQKAINIANASIDTYKGATTALASMPPPFNFIAAGAVVSAGLLNIKKIASTQFDGGSSVSPSPVQSPSFSGGGSGAPQTGSGIPINSTMLDRERIESGQNEQRVYVVESDISQTQNRVNTIVNRATVR
jgi:hypothetical protein